MSTIGVSAFYHDSAAALVSSGGEIMGAYQEERFTRNKGESRFPVESIKRCVDLAEKLRDPIRHLFFYERPDLKLERVLYSSSCSPKKELALDSAVRYLETRLWPMSSLSEQLEMLGIHSEVVDHAKAFPHHLSHAASAFFASPFAAGAVLINDGVGEFSSTSIWRGDGTNLEPLVELRFPHSLGLFYSEITNYLGFRVNSGEYKVMGLAPYGEPILVGKIRDNLIRTFDDGSFLLNTDIFGFFEQDTQVQSKFAEIFGFGKREPESVITRNHVNLAASVQKVLEEVILRQAVFALSKTEEENLALAGGVALNAVANGIIRSSLDLSGLWIQPAGGDAGGALGAALAGHHLENPENSKNRSKIFMQGCQLGTAYLSDEVKRVLETWEIYFEEVSREDVPHLVAELLSQNEMLAFFSGRMEFGPRALGNRSILANPMDPSAQDRLNLLVKQRESFRPFAPAVLEGHVAELFGRQDIEPYMVEVHRARGWMSDNVNREKFFSEEGVLLSGVNGGGLFPSVTHVDGTMRLQVVSQEEFENFHSILKLFWERTGCPMVLNTSFNVRGEPIVESPQNALTSFATTQLEFLVIENFLVRRKDQDPSLLESLTTAFAPD